MHETLIAGIEERKQRIHPDNLDEAFRNLTETSFHKGYSVELQLPYKHNMLARKSKEYKQNQYLLALFMMYSLDVVRVQGKAAPNMTGLDEMLAYLDRRELEPIFKNDSSVSHIVLTVRFEKRPVAVSQRTKDRIDYIVSYSRTIKYGGHINRNLHRHSMIIHAGCNYVDYYAGQEHDAVFLDDLLKLTEK